MRKMYVFLIGVVIFTINSFANDYKLANEARSNYEYEKSLALYEKACTSGDFRGCGEAGKYYSKMIFIPSESKIKKDIQKAIKLFEIACNNNLYDSCVSLGSLYIELDKKNYLQAEKVFEKACELGNYCNKLAQMYDEGTPNIAKNEKKALELYAKACEYEGEGCSRYLYIYDHIVDPNNKNFFEYIKVFHFKNEGLFFVICVFIIIISSIWFIIKGTLKKRKEKKLAITKKINEDNENKEYMLKFEKRHQQDNKNEKDYKYLLAKAIELGDERYIRLSLKEYKFYDLYYDIFDHFFDTKELKDNIEIFRSIFSKIKEPERTLVQWAREGIYGKQEGGPRENLLKEAFKSDSINIAEYLCYNLEDLPYIDGFIDFLIKNKKFDTLDCYLNKFYFSFTTIVVIKILTEIENVYELEDIKCKTTLTNKLIENNLFSLFNFASHNKNALKFFIDSKIDLNQTHENNETILMSKVKGSDVEGVKILIDVGVNLDLLNNSWKSSLMLAVENNNLEIVKLLINAGANLNLRDYNEKTSLMLAIENNNLEITKTLINAGADLNLQDTNGKTALILANEGSNTEIIKFFNKLT